MGSPMSHLLDVEKDALLFIITRLGIRAMNLEAEVESLQERIRALEESYNALREEHSLCMMKDVPVESEE